MGLLALRTEAFAPTPAPSYVYVYAKADGKLYRKDSNGAESEVGSGAGGGGGASSTPVNLVRFNVIGTLGNLTASRWYPNVAVTVSKIFVVANNPVEAAGSITIKRGTETVGTASFARFADRSSTADGLSIALTDLEFLAIEGGAVLGKNNFTVYIEYSPLYVIMPNIARLNILQTIGALAGTAKLYLSRIASVTKISLTAMDAVSLSIKKNDTQVATIALASNQFNVTQNITIALGADDYITADVLSSTPGINATLTLEYIT